MKQRGSALIVGGLVLGAVFGFGAIVGIISYIGHVNYGNATEQRLEAKYQDNQNTLAQYVQKVQEAAQVPAMMRDDMTKVVTAALQGRYGANGSQATFQWLKEQNPQLDPHLYVKIQQIVEAGRDSFKNSQTELIDIRRQYLTSLGNVWSGFWLRQAGYPKADLKKYDPVINTYTEDSFKTKIEKGPVQLR